MHTFPQFVLESSSLIPQRKSDLSGDVVEEVGVVGFGIKLAGTEEGITIVVGLLGDSGVTDSKSASGLFIERLLT